MVSGGLRRLGEVYGVARDLPLNYVPRVTIDGALREALQRDQHIVIHGSSKQGKTSLRKYNLDPDDYVVISCQSKWSLAELHSAVLKKAGFQVEQSAVRTTGGGNKVSAKASAKGGFSLLGNRAEAGVEAGGEVSREHSVQVESHPLELDPADPNDVITALAAVDFAKFIVLEDFHYLPDETQAEFAVALKTFHEASGLVFMIIGVWLDENRLIQHNGDLAGRVMTINADQWTASELRQVVHEGERLLNIQFSKQFVDDLIDLSFDSVWVIQEVCYLACRAEGIDEEQEDFHPGVASSADVRDLIDAVVEAQSARYNGFLEHFPDGFQRTEQEMYRWLLLPVLMLPTAQLERGVHIDRIKQIVGSLHPNRVADMSYLHALRMTPALQVRKGIKPIVIDFDRTTRKMTIVDRGFLIWLEHQDRLLLLELCGLTEAVDGGKLAGLLAAARTAPRIGGR